MKRKPSKPNRRPKRKTKSKRTPQPKAKPSALVAAAIGEFESEHDEITESPDDPIGKFIADTELRRTATDSEPPEIEEAEPEEETEL
jgi:hypothetical protein